MRIGIYQAYWGLVGGGQRYVGVLARKLAERHDVEIVHHHEGFIAEPVAWALDVDLSKISFRYIPAQDRRDDFSRNPFVRYRQERDWGRELSQPYDVFIDSSDKVPFFCQAKTGVLLTHFPHVSFEVFHSQKGPQWSACGPLSKAVRSVYHRLEWRQRFGTYRLCLCNSRFTQSWIHRRWGVKAAVLYPPTRNSFCQRRKAKMILNIAAFHAAKHKNHALLIDAFKECCDSGLTGWNLVLAGSAQGTLETSAYIDELRQQGAGYPITIHTNVGASELRGLLEKAALFWHAMGHGVDPEVYPEKMEHFGMVATEAMAAGCVPLVFDGGGLPESIVHGQCGFLWRTKTELRDFTLGAAQDGGLRERFGQAARLRAQDFSEEVFEKRALEALAPVLG